MLGFASKTKDLLGNENLSTLIPSIAEYNETYAIWQKLSNDRGVLIQRQRALQEKITGLEEVICQQEADRKQMLREVALSGHSENLKEADHSLSLLRSELQQQHELADAIRGVIPEKDAEIESVKQSLKLLWRTSWAKISEHLVEQAPKGLSDYFVNLITAMSVTESASLAQAAFRVCPLEISHRTVENRLPELAKAYGLPGIPPSF